MASLQPLPVGGTTGPDFAAGSHGKSSRGSSPTTWQSARIRILDKEVAALQDEVAHLRCLIQQPPNQHRPHPVPQPMSPASTVEDLYETNYIPDLLALPSAPAQHDLPAVPSFPILQPICSNDESTSSHKLASAVQSAYDSACDVLLDTVRPRLDELDSLFQQLQVQQQQQQSCSGGNNFDISGPVAHEQVPNYDFEHLMAAASATSLVFRLRSAALAFDLLFYGSPKEELIQSSHDFPLEALLAMANDELDIAMCAHSEDIGTVDLLPAIDDKVKQLAMGINATRRGLIQVSEELAETIRLETNFFD